MISQTTIQSFLTTEGFYTGKVDGIPGPATIAAGKALLAKHRIDTASWPNDRVLIAVTQLFLNKVNGATLVPDGYAGRATNDAIYIYNTVQLHSIPVKNLWPRQRDVPAFFGQVGRNQVMVQCPFMMYGDYDRRIKVPHFSAHRKVAQSIERVLARTLEHYGAAQIKKLQLDIFSGCLNVRRITGGSGYSMHSWGIAIDFDAAHNQFAQTSRSAAFAKPVYAPFLDFWEAEGWVSLGRARNYDWMHVQAARL